MNRVYSVTLETSDPDIVVGWINRMHLADKVISLQFIETVASFVIFYVGEFNPYTNNLKE